MTADRVAAWTTGIGLLLGVGYLFAGLVGWIVDVADGDQGDLAFWLVLLVGGGAALLVSLFYSGLPRGVALVLAIVGALAGSPGAPPGRSSCRCSRSCSSSSRAPRGDAHRRCLEFGRTGNVWPCRSTSRRLPAPAAALVGLFGVGMGAAGALASRDDQPARAADRARPGRHPRRPSRLARTVAAPTRC